MNCANHPDRGRIAFCQSCGKPLCAECSRTVGNAVFCEPCLVERLAAANAASSAGTPYGHVPYGAPTAPPPPVPGAPNPAFAGLLGLIPGVGAMYNGQYAKGVVHLVIFATLVSLSDTNGIFGLFVAGWVIYQVIEAYHTARARRDGVPPPNPFGLNDIGERLGFGRSWVGTAAAPPAGPPPPQANEAGFSQGAGDSTAYTAPSASTPNWSEPTPGDYARTAPPAPSTPYSGLPFTPADPLPPSDRDRFPVGAILLIAFGVLFFVGSSGWFHHFPIQRILPFLLIGVGVWTFVRRMTSAGLGIADDGSPAYQYRLFYALRGSIWILLVGIMFFLDSFDILSWAHSWPLFIIVAGLMMVLKRSSYTSALPGPYAYYAAAGSAPPYAPAQAPSAPTVPAASHDEEGR